MFALLMPGTSAGCSGAFGGRRGAAGRAAGETPGRCLAEAASFDPGSGEGALLRDRCGDAAAGAEGLAPPTFRSSALFAGCFSGTTFRRVSSAATGFRMLMPRAFSKMLSMSSSEAAADALSPISGGTTRTCVSLRSTLTARPAGTGTSFGSAAAFSFFSSAARFCSAGESLGAGRGGSFLPASAACFLALSARAPFAACLRGGRCASVAAAFPSTSFAAYFFPPLCLARSSRSLRRCSSVGFGFAAVASVSDPGSRRPGDGRP
mmetsp:Transcript_24491/g.72650  ORF Transcript_24491/g.72650 Transcript_24491/m.72650 type:complete len:264 (+) Transcript_24491:550-1341(+)